MARKWVMMGAVLAAIGMTAPVAAQSVDDDVRCLLASNFFGHAAKDPQGQKIAQASAAFYLGRLDARISTQQLVSAEMAQAKTMTKDSLGPIMTNCAKRLMQKGIAQRTLAGPPPAGAGKPAPSAQPK